MCRKAPSLLYPRLTYQTLVRHVVGCHNKRPQRSERFHGFVEHEKYQRIFNIFVQGFKKVLNVELTAKSELATLLLRVLL